MRRATSLACAIAVLCLSACAPKTDAEAERGRIQQLLAAYFQSVKTADITLASRIWLQSPDVVAVTPLGRNQGWDSVQRDLYVNFLQKGFLERELRASNVHIGIISGDAAWAVFDWDFTGKLANGQPMTSKGRESHVYIKTADGWRITHLHYSGLLPPQ